MQKVYKDQEVHGKSPPVLTQPSSLQYMQVAIEMRKWSISLRRKTLLECEKNRQFQQPAALPINDHSNFDKSIFTIRYRTSIVRPANFHEGLSLANFTCQRVYYFPVSSVTTNDKLGFGLVAVFAFMKPPIYGAM